MIQYFSDFLSMFEDIYFSYSSLPQIRSIISNNFIDFCISALLIRIFKIFAKILIKRFKNFFPNLVDHFQGTFIRATHKIILFQVSSLIQKSHWQLQFINFFKYNKDEFFPSKFISWIKERFFFFGNLSRKGNYTHAPNMNRT